MKFQKILSEYLTESLLTEIKNKEILRQLVSKWSDLLDEKTSLKYIEWFSAKDQSFFNLNKTYQHKDPDTGETTEYVRVQPQIAHFLDRFRDFPEEFLGDIQKYTSEQIKFLFDEYNYNKETKSEINVFTTNPQKNPTNPQKIDKSPNSDKIIASKDLWYDESKAIINESGFRVYQINGEQEAINFGYYIYALANRYSERDANGYTEEVKNQVVGQKLLSGVGTWCILPHMGNTQYGNKRQDRQFYFVIDEDKNPQNFDNPENAPRAADGYPITYYYISALQAMSDGRTFALTNLKNPGEPLRSWDFISTIYPKIRNKLNLIKFNPMSANELLDNSFLRRINESEGSQYEFAKLPARLQRAYLNGDGHPPALTRGKSWAYMDDNLRAHYIFLTDEKNYLDRFSTFDLLYEIIKNVKDTNLLNKRLSTRLGLKNVTVQSLLVETMRNGGQFEVYRRSKKHPNIEIWLSLASKKYCIYDTNKKITSANATNFYTQGGIEYKPEYTLIDKDGEIFTGNDGELYHVDEFAFGGNKNNPQNFYSVTLLDDNALKVQSTYFYTFKGFKKLRKSFLDAEGDGDNLPDGKTIDMSKDSDIG